MDVQDWMKPPGPMYKKMNIDRIVENYLGMLKGFIAQGACGGDGTRVT